MKNPAIISFEYQARDEWLAQQFLRVLKIFDITPYYDSIMPTYADSSIIKFQATVRERIQIEYVYRRLCRMDYIFVEIKGYQANQSKFYHDGYCILGDTAGRLYA